MFLVTLGNITARGARPLLVLLSVVLACCKPPNSDSDLTEEEVNFTHTNRLLWASAAGIAVLEEVDECSPDVCAFMYVDGGSHGSPAELYTFRWEELIFGTASPTTVLVSQNTKPATPLELGKRYVVVGHGLEYWKKACAGRPSILLGMWNSSCCRLTFTRLEDDGTYVVPEYHNVPAHRYTLEQFRNWAAEAKAQRQGHSYPPAISNENYCGPYDAGGADIVLLPTP